MFKNLLSKLGRRLQEGSTWAALSALLLAFGIVTPQQAAMVATAGADIGQAVSGSNIEMNLGLFGGAVSALIAGFLPDRGGK